MKLKNSLLAGLFALMTAGAFAFEAPRTVVQTGKLPVAEHYNGGQDSLVAHLQRSIQYPALAKRNRMQGQCIIGFTLQEDGAITNLKILKEVGGGTGQEALRVVQLLKFKAPGYSQQYSVPVNFKL
ncbi:energy transducer TonB [Rufibacter quisquiliarum]|uniref:Protein TonB n=1 Tax=Rufibacter quisquiliarum TaxID=1549639 RepID=A0A839G7W7_9BACT|nr:energy transducer TonB [Rufibacter quisquiliarum]MBA9075524.1 protein TonB [Rufibacter quisquiliarum]